MAEERTIISIQHPLTLFCEHVALFSKTNWWIFVVFAFGVLAVAMNSSGDILEISSIFSLHFVADIFVMMMVSEYAVRNFRSGTLYQVTAVTLFLALKVQTGWVHGGWHYLSADVIYVLAAVKNYWKDVRSVDITWINTKTTSIISAIIFFGVYIPNQLIEAPSQYIQTIGIFVFAIALASSQNEKLRYILSIIGLASMVGGSAWESVRTFGQGELVGLAFSYFLLPATVLIFYLKLWRGYMNSGE